MQKLRCTMFLEEHPGTFRKLLRKRNNVESVFSSMKERFGGVVRAVSELRPAGGARLG